MEPATGMMIAAAIQAAGSIGGGMLAAGGQSDEETKIQRRKRRMIDSLLSSLEGNGPYSDLFQTDEKAFQKSYVEPSLSLFRNKIAPAIQQQFAAGEQRGTAMDDQLARAGVDLDAMINSGFMDWQNQAMNRKQNAINSILGGGEGAANMPSTGQNLMSAGAGYLSSDAFANSIDKIFNAYSQEKPANTSIPGIPPPRKGYAPDWRQGMQEPIGSKYWNQGV